MIKPIAVTESASDSPSSVPVSSGLRPTIRTPDSTASTVPTTMSMPSRQSTAYITIGSRPHNVGPSVARLTTIEATKPTAASRFTNRRRPGGSSTS